MHSVPLSLPLLLVLEQGTLDVELMVQQHSNKSNSMQSQTTGIRVLAQK